MKPIILASIALMLAACASNVKEPEQAPIECDTLPTLCPEVTFHIQPYGGFTQEEAQALIPKLEKSLDSVYAGAWSFKVLPNKDLPDSAYYKPRDRYLANEMLKALPEGDIHNYPLGLMHEDISYAIHGQDNYGIMGLTPLGGMKSIVSDFRASGDDFVKVIVHEIGHGIYAAKHCSDSNCIMCDFQKLKSRRFSLSVCDEHRFMQ